MVEQPAEPLLGSVCQTALELITADNSPDGDCCICLRAMHAQTTPLFLLTTCYHCFHTDCARAYVGWRDENPPEEAPMHLRVASGYVEPPLFQCPVCRRVPGDADLERVKTLKEVRFAALLLRESPSLWLSPNATPIRLHVQEARAASEARVGASGAGGEGDDEVSLLSKAMLEELVFHQKRMAGIREKQSAKGGLVGMRDPPPASEAQPPALQPDGQDTRAGKGGRRRGRDRKRVGPIAPEPSAGGSDGRQGGRGGCSGGEEGSGGRGRGRGRGGGEAGTVDGSRGRGHRRGRGRGVVSAESPADGGQERNRARSGGGGDGGNNRAAHAAS